MRRAPRPLPDHIEQTLAGLWQETSRMITGRPAAARLGDHEFALKYLAHTPLFPATGPAQWFAPAALHYRLSEAADAHQRLLVQVAREFGKSSLFSLIRPLRLICENPDVRIVIISKTAEAAEKFTGVIRYQLEHNVALITDYGRFKSEAGPWTNAQFTVVRHATYKEPTVQAVGRGGQIVSGRYDVVIVDDGEDFESTKTPHARLDTYQWFMRDVVPVVQAGSIIVIQTPQHEADLIGQVKQQVGWVFLTIPAESELPPLDTTAPAEVLAQEPKVRRVSAWPEKWPIYFTNCAVKQVEERGASEARMAEVAREACPKCAIFTGGAHGVGCLTGKRFEVGSLFYRLQYLCDPAALGGEVFKPEWFRIYSRDQLKYRNGAWHYTPPDPDLAGQSFPLEIVMGVDPAIAEEDEQAPANAHSRFAVVILGYARRIRRRLLLHYENLRVDFPTQARIIHEQFTTWSPKQIGIEDVSYQKALRQQVVRAWRLPVKGLKPDRDKFRRIASLTPEIEAGNVYLREDHDEVRQQALQFPRGAHDDILDAWYYADQLVGMTRMFEDYRAAPEPQDCSVCRSRHPQGERCPQAAPTIEELRSLGYLYR